MVYVLSFSSFSHDHCVLSSTACTSSCIFSDQSGISDAVFLSGGGSGSLGGDLSMTESPARHQRRSWIFQVQVTGARRIGSRFAISIDRNSLMLNDRIPFCVNSYLRRHQQLRVQNARLARGSVPEMRRGHAPEHDSLPGMPDALKPRIGERQRRGAGFYPTSRG